MNSLLLSLKKLALDVFSCSLQTLDINYRPPRATKYRRSLTQRPKDQPGLVLPLPRRCGVCGSYLLGYDSLNVVSCDSCDSILSVSGRWHNSTLGNIKPLTARERARARYLRSAEPPCAENPKSQDAN